MKSPVLDGIPVPKWLNQGTYLEPLGGENARVPRLEVDNATTYIDKDGSNNMTFTDAVSGTKTLAQLIAGAHTQNTDTILTTDGATALINAGKLVADLTTDRWLSSVTNTFLGNGVAGVGGLSHTTGSTGWNNTGIGTNALYSITTGLSNTGVGNSALLSLTTAQHNTGVGVSALYALTTGGMATGGLNSAFGSGSLQACTVGYYNCGFGVDSLFACIGGYNNIGIGVSSLAGITSGYQNVAIGGAAGAALTTESGNVFIGHGAGQNATGSNQLYIANSNTATPLILGDFAGLTLTFPNTTILRWNNAAGTVKNILWLDASDILYLVNNAGAQLNLQTGIPDNIVCWGGVEGLNRQLILAGTDSATGAGNVKNSALLNVRASYRDASNVQTYWSGKIQHYMDTGGATPASRVIHSINDVDIIRVFNTNGVIGVTIGSNPYATQPSGSLGVAGGVMIGANSLNNLIDDASGGTGSTALYIGNAQIATTADITTHEGAADPHTVYPLDSEVLKKDGSVALTADWLIGEQAIQLDSAISADGKYSGITEAGTAGAVLAFGDLVYFAVADSRWELADASAEATTKPKLGICVLAAAGDGSATTILLWGKVNAATAFPALTIGAPAFVGEVAGDIVVAAPTTAASCIRCVGQAITADELFFNPSPDWFEHV